MIFFLIIVPILIVIVMDSNQNNIVIANINLVIQRISNTFVNKLSFGVISNQHLNEAKLLYLYRRVLEDRTFSDIDYLTEDEYNGIYIDVQRITKK
jgi:hypothetical protein